jgi:CheY-specific phosphatase CheX
MTNVATRTGRAVPLAIVDAVQDAVNNTYSAFFSEKPRLAARGLGHPDGPSIAGIICFLGEVPWSLAWILTADTATLLAKNFAGFEIPFDSPDMGDLAGELVNVFAGEIVAQLERRQIQAQMSLPTVARGSRLELVPENDSSVVHLEYTSKEGIFWFRLAWAKKRSAHPPGK